VAYTLLKTIPGIVKSLTRHPLRNREHQPLPVCPGLCLLCQARQALEGVKRQKKLSL